MYLVMRKRIRWPTLCLASAQELAITICRSFVLVRSSSVFPIVKNIGEHMTDQLFALGQMVATPAALAALEDSKQTPLDFIKRHAAGDWGDCCPEDAEANNEAVWNEERVFSVYHTANGTKVYCITEADRSSTCVLLPSDY